MKTSGTIGLVLLVGGWLFGAASAMAQSDNCGHAPLIGVGIYSGDTSAATPDGVDNCNGGNSSPDVWYAFQAPASGLLAVYTCGSQYDTVLSVHSGCPGTLFNQVGCNDDACGVQSTVQVQVVGGQTYWIRVAGFLGDFGPYSLSVGFIATNRAGGCAQAANISDGTYTNTTVGASSDGANNCTTGDGPDVWYAYTAPFSGILHLDTCGSALDTVLSVHSGCPGTAANVLACNDDNQECGLQARVSLPVTAGQTYRIRVAIFGGATGPYTLNVRLAPAAANDCIGPPAIRPGTHSGTTVGATLDGASTCGGAAPDVWYAFIPPTAGTLVLDTCGSAFDTVLSVHGGCPGNTVTQLACNDDAQGAGPCPGGYWSYLTLPVTGGLPYRIRIAGFSTGAVGSYTLNASFVEAGSDSCINAPLIQPGIHTGTTIAASADGTDNCGGSGPDVWYAFAPPTDGSLRLFLCGSAFDTVLSLHTACGANPIACNDDWCGLSSHLAAEVTGGTTYLIRVTGFAAYAGAYVLQMEFSACRADWNEDGDLNSSDISAFITSWLSSILLGTLSADFNGDQTVNSSDISAFITAWLDAIINGC